MPVSQLNGPNKHDMERRDDGQVDHMPLEERA